MDLALLSSSEQERLRTALGLLIDYLLKVPIGQANDLRNDSWPCQASVIREEGLASQAAPPRPTSQRAQARSNREEHHKTSK